MNNSKPTIAVIGDKAVSQLFQAVGYACYADTEPAAIIARCNQLAADGCQIILILEQQAQTITDYLEQRAGDAYPIILPIPDTIPGESFGRQRLQENLAKACGRQIGGEQ